MEEDIGVDDQRAKLSDENPKIMQVKSILLLLFSNPAL